LLSLVVLLLLLFHALQAGLEEDKFVPKNGTYIASSYVKFVESGGARVVPILPDTPADVVSTNNRGFK
jgi:hypothetical protein